MGSLKTSETPKGHWRAIANLSLFFLSLLLLVAAALLLIFAATLGVSAEGDWRLVAGSVLVGLTAIACLLFAYFFFRAISAEGKKDPSTYKASALAVLGKFPLLVTSITALSALLALIFAIGC